ncbi:MAG: glycerophosphodiester phosphodiesterase [Bacteroidetes bacterium]|nr:MAG: glycerophosphodiester phosphodiesterase [Bacteroidota bacterium]
MMGFPKIIVSVLLASLIGLAACRSDKPEPFPEGLVFGHRGSGVGIFEGKYIENTKSALRYGLQHLDGCELDIQMSLDGSLWVYHDDVLNHFCEPGIQQVCIPKSKDVFLESINQCRDSVTDRIYRLSEIFDLFQENDFSDKFLSLDVKGYFSEECFPGQNAPKEYFVEMASELCQLIKKYDLSTQVLVETDYEVFLDEVKSGDAFIKCHLLGYENFQEKMEIALEKNYDGLSFSLAATSLTADLVQEAKRKGLQVQLWPVHDQLSLQKARDLKAFSMQVSDIHLVQ